MYVYVCKCNVKSIVGRRSGGEGRGCKEGPLCSFPALHSFIRLLFFLVPASVWWSTCMVMSLRYLIYSLVDRWVVHLVILICYYTSTLDLVLIFNPFISVCYSRLSYRVVIVTIKRSLSVFVFSFHFCTRSILIVYTHALHCVAPYALFTHSKKEQSPIKPIPSSSSSHHTSSSSV